MRLISEKFDKSILANWGLDKGAREVLHTELYDTLRFVDYFVSTSSTGVEYTFFREPIGVHDGFYKTRARTNMQFPCYLPAHCQFVATGLRLEQRETGRNVRFKRMKIEGGYGQFYIGSKMFWTFPTDIGVGICQPCFIDALQNFCVSIILPERVTTDLRCRLVGYYCRPVQ